MEELNTVLSLESFAGLFLNLKKVFVLIFSCYHEYFSDTVHTQESQENVMYVRFYTNSRYPNNGLSAKVKIGKIHKLQEQILAVQYKNMISTIMSRIRKYFCFRRVWWDEISW